MFQAYVLVKVAPGQAPELYRKISTLDSVVEAELVYGEYDLILKIQKNAPEQLDDFVFNQLRKIQGISSTATCICASSIT